MLVLLLSILLVSSSIDDDGRSRVGGGADVAITLFFVGVGRGRVGRERFSGGVVDGERAEDDVPLTTAAIVSEIAKMI